ncbi:Organic cation transporter protein [Camponotus japonicus]
MAYDDVILRMGEFGRYQRRVYLLLCLPAISCAFHKLAGVFLGAKMNSRCLLPHEFAENATFHLSQNILNASYPWDDELKGWSQCLSYDVIGATNGTIVEEAIGEGGGISRCKQYVYDRSVYKSTTTSDWDLVCDRAWLRATGDSLFMVGVMLGSMIFGGLSDKYGRRPIFFLSLIIQLVGGTLVAVAPEFISYVIFRLIVGSTTSGVFLVAYVIALEMVGPKKRLIAGVGVQLFFTIGYLLTAAFAYYITNWRMLQVALTIPSIVFLLYWWFIPESARWLLTKGRHQEAKDLLQRASLENGVEIPSETFDTLLNNKAEESTPDAKKPSVFDLFRYPNLRRKSIVLFFNWLVNSGTYYGLSWHASNLGGNDHLNFVISGVVEIPAYTFLIFTLNRWGRKISLCGCMMLSGLALLATLFVPADMPWLVVTLAMIGKLAITSSYGAIYVFTAEQFPTVIRNVGLGASSTFARVGGVIAPYINHLSELWTPLPLVIFGSCALLGGLMSLLLPETLNKKLPETIQDGELFGKKSSKKKKKQQLDHNQLNDIEVIKPLKLQEKQNGVHEKQNG